MASDFPAHIAFGMEQTVVREFTPGTDSNEPFIPGDLVFYDPSDDVVQLCGTNPALIAGISEVNSANVAGANAITPSGKVPVRLIKTPNVTLVMASATTPVAATHIGSKYGITRNSAGHWLVDTAKTSGPQRRVFVFDVDVTNGIFYVQLIADHIQFGAIS